MDVSVHILHRQGQRRAVSHASQGFDRLPVAATTSPILGSPGPHFHLKTVAMTDIAALSRGFGGASLVKAGKWLRHI